MIQQDLIVHVRVSQRFILIMATSQNCRLCIHSAEVYDCLFLCDLSLHVSNTYTRLPSRYQMDLCFNEKCETDFAAQFSGDCCCSVREMHSLVFRSVLITGWIDDASNFEIDLRLSITMLHKERILVAREALVG